MANEMKELHGAVFELTPDMISAVSLDEIEVEDMTPKTRNVKDDTSDKRHRVDDETLRRHRLQAPRPGSPRLPP